MHHPDSFMKLCFQIAFRESHHIAGEVVALAEKLNMHITSLTLQQLKSVRYDNFMRTHNHFIALYMQIIFKFMNSWWDVLQNTE